MNFEGDNNSSYFSFLKNAFKYDIRIASFFTQFISESVKIFTTVFPLLIFISFVLGIICGSNMLSTFSKNFLLSINKEEIISNCILVTSFLEVAPCFVFFMFLGQYAIPISMQTYKRRTSGYFTSYDFLGVNAVSFVCLAKILSSFFMLPMLCVFCCFFILSGAVFPCLFFDIDIRTFVSGYVYFFNYKYIIICFLKVCLNGFICCSLALYIGFYHELKNNDDISSVGTRCFLYCCVAFILCDFILDFLFFLF